MTFRDAARAWWGAWKYVAILGLALAASLWGNALQWRAKHAAKAEARAETLEDALKVTAGVARGAQRDSSELLAELRTIADRGRSTRVIYRNAAAARPLAPNCAPGQARIDAVNAGADPE